MSKIYDVTIIKKEVYRVEANKRDHAVSLALEKARVNGKPYWVQGVTVRGALIIGEKHEDDKE